MSQASPCDESPGGLGEYKLEDNQSFSMPGRRFGAGFLAAWEAVILEPDNCLGWAAGLIRGSCLKSRAITASEKVN